MINNRREGRRRLGILLGGVSGGIAVALMAALLIVYGAPFQPLWWWVMAAILIAAFLAPRLLTPAIEWVVEGYQGDETS